MQHKRKISLAFSISVLYVIGYTYVDAMLWKGPMPAVLQDCYKEQEKLTNLTVSVGHAIQTFCLRKYLYSTMLLRKSTSLNEEQWNYILSLAREGKIMFENKRRGKRQNIPIRRECRVLSQEEWRDLTDAINVLKNDTNIAPNYYDILALLHSGGETLGNAHNGPNFLGWHRCYLYYVEIALRRVNPRVSLCYWDSTLDHGMSEPSRSVMFGPEYFGNGDGVVLNGPFRNWVLPNTNPPQRLRRAIHEMGSLMVYDRVLNVLNAGGITRTEQISVGGPSAIINTIEGLHNNVHVWVGEIMGGTETSPQDPVFFFHHCFIDYFWEKFREKQEAAGINPENDYPSNLSGILHVPERAMAAFPWIENRQGFTNVFTRWYFRYEDSPSCDNNCSGSRHLTCDVGRNRCISNVRPLVAADFGARTNGFSSEGKFEAAKEGTLQISARFAMNMMDERIGRGSVRDKRSISQNTHQFENHLENKTNHKNIKSAVVELGGDSMDKPALNSFLLDGVADRNLWSWFPVRILHSRPYRNLYNKGILENQFPNADLYYETADKKYVSDVAVYDKRHHMGSGANKIYVQTDGITYTGRYRNYAIIDDRELFEIRYTYIAIKKPVENKTDTSIITAYDGDGRVCKPKCLEKDVRNRSIYRSCSGVINSSSEKPLMMSHSYNDAVEKFWKMAYFSTDVGHHDVFLEFHCDASPKWPWV